MLNYDSDIIDCCWLQALLVALGIIRNGKEEMPCHGGCNYRCVLGGFDLDPREKLNYE